MVNHYKLFFSYFFIFESFVKIFGFNIYPINGKNLQKIKQVLMDPRFSESPKEKEKGRNYRNKNNSFRRSRSG
jgi:hypothetical protein